ncbi:MAG: TPM domain-containing protein [Rhodospirillaceae bacterium]|nr:TPM domain-containing protein [Rhodospirillaceae bacterium]
MPISVALRYLWLAALFVLLGLPAANADPVVPPLTGRVVDLADVLTSAAERDLTTQLAKVEQKTGTQIVVAILPDLGRYSIESWGLALGRTWKIGRPGKDDGIVIVLAPKDREIRIEVGYGLEGRVTDATAHQIIQRYMLPAAREGRYATGLDATIGALERVIVDPSVPVPAVSAPFRYGNVIIVVLFGGMAVLVLIGMVMSIGTRREQVYPARPDERSDSVFDNNNHGGWTWNSGSGSSSSSNSISFGSSSSSSSGSSFRGGGGSFGGGGASGKW